MGQQPWSKHFASASSFNACATAMVTQATLHMFASFSWPKWHQTVHRPAPAKGSLRFIINDGLSMTARQFLSSMPEKDWSCGGAICHQPMVPPTSTRRKSRKPCRLSADQTLAGAKWFHSRSIHLGIPEIKPGTLRPQVFSEKERGKSLILPPNVMDVELGNCSTESMFEVMAGRHPRTVPQLW